jgi:BolA protein
MQIMVRSYNAFLLIGCDLTMTVQLNIESKLSIGLNPEHMLVVNESHMHNVPPHSETHFKVVVVSAVFNGKRDVARHQLIYKLLAEEMAGPIHALALHTYTMDEWQLRNVVAPDSPECMGGSKSR